ncbi:MAG: D-arabinono-1,4-lactone oxidase [Acidimicrobiales bacterium]
MALSWQNWSGAQRCSPVAIDHPADAEGLAQVVKLAASSGQAVKAVGSGHSFTDIACTDGRLVVLDRYDRVLSADLSSGLVTVQAGITISRLNEELALRGLAMANLGDIGYQTVAGAISTGTHGTGIGLGGLATQVVGLELVTGDGSLLRCSADEEPDVFAAARVGLGALGLLSTVTLQCVPAFHLHALEQPMRLDEVLESLDEHVEGNDHFEFFWQPHTDRVMTKRNNRTEEPISTRGRWKEWRDKILLENVAFGAVCRIGRARPSLIPRLNETIASGFGKVWRVERSDRVFTTPRYVHFNEMEYSLPRAAAADAVRELRSLIDRSGWRIGFPVEVRFTAGDDIWLSTAHGGERSYIAVHVYRGMPYEQYFRGVEAIMSAAGGRPHWGKLHFQTAATLAPRYPHWADFLAVRARLDPESRFANPYLDRVLG